MIAINLANLTTQDSSFSCNRITYSSYDSKDPILRESIETIIRLVTHLCSNKYSRVYEVVETTSCNQPTIKASAVLLFSLDLIILTTSSMCFIYGSPLARI